MITLISSLLTLYAWVVICLLLYFLFLIARFFQQKSGRQSRHVLFLVSAGLFAVAAIQYAWAVPAITGDFVADLLRFLAGVILIATGYFLLILMIGKPS